MFLETNERSSRSQMFPKKGVLINFANFTGKHLCWSLGTKQKKYYEFIIHANYCQTFFFDVGILFLIQVSLYSSFTSVAFVASFLSGPHLGKIVPRKPVDAQNRKYPNKDMREFPKTQSVQSKRKYKAYQMLLCAKYSLRFMKEQT